MIHFHCAWCERELRAEDNRAGQAVICPDCKGRVVIPQQGIAEKPGGTPPGVRAAPARWPRLKRRIHEDEEEQSGGWFTWVRDRLLVQLFIVFVVWLGLFGLGIGLQVPLLIVAAAILGYLVSLVGHIWFLFVAFSDSPRHGVCCFIVPCYAFVYFILNFEETKRPFFVELAGFILVMLAHLAMEGVA
jgi:hypothetical protein